MGSDYTLPPTEILKAAAEPVAIRAGTSGNSLRVFGPEPEVWHTSIVNQSIKPYQNTRGEKEVEIWREKGDGRIEGDVVNEQDVSTMDLGADTDSCAPDLVDPRWNLEAVEAAGGLDKHWATELKTPREREINAREGNYETTEELPHSDRPVSSEGLAVASTIRNPIVTSIRTASEWDPGPEELDDAIPATRAGRDPAITLSPEAMDPATGENQDHWADSPGGGQRSSNWKPFRTWGKSHTRIGGILMAEIEGRQIWDPGGGRAESLILAGRCGKRRGRQGRRKCAGGELGGACREASIRVLRCLWSHGDVVASCRCWRCWFVWAGRAVRGNVIVLCT